MSAKPKPLNRFRQRLARRILGRLPQEEPAPALPPLTEQQLEEARTLFPMPKFFIFGYPRSGTTLLMRLISLHPEVHCSREAHFFTQAGDATQIFADADIRSWLERKSNRWTSGQGLETALVRLVADFLMEREAARLGKTVVGDKTPNGNAGLAVQRLHAVYPEARLIYIVRDGRDAALSHRFQHFIDQPELLAGDDLRIRREFISDSRPFFEKKKSLFTPKAIENEAHAWAKNVTETHDLGQSMLGDRYLCLRYEDLLTSPFDHIHRLWGFLQVDANLPGLEGLVQAKMEYNPGVNAQAEKEKGLAQILPRGKQGNWRELFTPHDRQVFKKGAGEALIDWHYEKDQNW